MTPRHIALATGGLLVGLLAGFIAGTMGSGLNMAQATAERDELRDKLTDQMKLALDTGAKLVTEARQAQAAAEAELAALKPKKVQGG